MAKNLDTIGDSAALAVAALAGPLGARLLGGAGSRVAAPFRAAGADAREGLASATGAVAATRAAREAAQVELQQAQLALAALESQPRFRQAAPDVQQAYERQAAQVDKLREASAKTAERESAALLKRAEAETVAAQISQTAAGRVVSAKETLERREAALNDLLAKRPALEQAAASAGVNVSRRQQGGYYDALYRVVEQRDKLADTNATIALTKRNIEALDEAIARERSAKTASDFVPIALQRRQAEMDRLPLLTGQRDEQGRILNESEKRLIEAERRIGEAQATERDKAGRKLAEVDNQISRARAAVAGQAEKVVAAEVRANETLIASAEKQARVQADLDAKAIAAAAQRRAAQQALSEAEGRLGGLAGQVGTSAAAQRTQAIQQVEAAQVVLNRTYFAEQEALGRAAEASNRASAAKVALAGVARTAGNALSGMIGMLGGPLGAALTAASVGLLGYELYQARAAASAEKHSEALAKLASRMQEIASQTEAGQSRTSGERLADSVTNRDALRGVRDRRNKVLDNFQAAQDRAESEVSSVSAQLPGGASNSLDVAAQRLNINLSQVVRAVRTLSPSTDEAVRASQTLATVLEEVARVDPRYAERAVEARKLANEQASAAATARKFAEAQKANDDLAGRTGSRQAVYDGEGLGPLTRSPQVSAEETKAKLAQIEGYAKTVGASLLEIGGQSYSFPELTLMRERLQGAVKDIATVRAQAPAMLSGFSVPPALFDVVQAFARGQESAEGYAQRLRELREANPNFAPLIDSLLKANEVALKASVQIDSVGARVDALDGKSAEVNILVRTTSLASVKVADAKEVEDQTAAAEKAMTDLQAKTYNLQLRAKGETARAKAIELQGSNPGLDLRAATEEIRKQEALEERISALGKKGRGGGGRKSREQRSAETLGKKLEELDQDASVAALNDFDQKTVRFAQSAKVASEQIQAFIAAAKSGDMSSVPPVMQEIYDKMRQLEGVKLGKAALDGIFPGRLLAEQIESVRRAAVTSPEIAANLDQIIERMRAAAAPDWAKSAAGSISNFAESAITDFGNIGQAANALTQDLVKIAIRAAILKPLEQSIGSALSGGAGGSSAGLGDVLASFFGASSGGGGSPTGGVRLFHEGGEVTALVPPTRRLSLAQIHRAPRYHTGLGSDEFAAVLRQGERVLTSEQNLRAQDTVSALSERAAMTPRMSMPASPVEVTINNNAPVNVQTKEVPDGRGGRRLEVQIDEVVEQALSRPGSRSAAAMRRPPIATR